MRMSIFVCSGYCAFFLTSCSAPPLALATGTPNSGVLVGDIVQRVKCEVSDAFDDKLTDGRFVWLRNWTVAVDLTLGANTSGGFTGSGNHTDVFHNIISNAGSAVAQNFTFGASANLSETATRSDIVSFAMSLPELYEWRESLDRAERMAHIPLEKSTCNPGGRRELVGHLGLSEWTDAALYPVAKTYLQAGDHPNAGASKSSSKSAGPKPGGAHGPSKSTSFVLFNVPTNSPEEQAQRAKDLTDEIFAIDYAVKRTASATQFCDTYAQYASTLTTKMDDTRSAFTDAAYEAKSYGPSLASYYKRLIDTGMAKLNSEIDAGQRDVDVIKSSCGEAKTKAGDLANAAKNNAKNSDDLNKLLADLKAKNEKEHGFDLYNQKLKNQPIPKNPSDPDQTYKDATGVLDSFDPEYARIMDKVDLAARKAFEASKDAKQIASNLDVIASVNAPDPPITTISHLIQFEVDYGAGVSPNWMLGLWKGPSASGSLFSFSGQRTNILNIAIGPRTSPIKVGDEQRRVLNDQILLLTRPPAQF